MSIAQFCGLHGIQVPDKSIFVIDSRYFEFRSRNFMLQNLTSEHVINALSHVGSALSFEEIAMIDAAHHNLRIDNSINPASGKGLFCNVDILKAGTCIPMLGKLARRSVPVDPALRNRTVFMNYCVLLEQTAQGWVLEDLNLIVETWSAASYANDFRGFKSTRRSSSELQNGRLVSISSSKELNGPLASIELTRDVKRDEEILISYGPEYFGPEGWNSLP
jgi:hypothetical protein